MAYSLQEDITLTDNGLCRDGSCHGPTSSPLEEELIEISEKLYHKEVARFQLGLHQRRTGLLSDFKETVSWFCVDGINAVHAVLEKDREIQEEAARETESYVRRQRLTLEQRQQAIRVFCRR